MSQSFWQFLSPEPGTNRTSPQGKNPDGNAKGGPMKDPLRFNIGYAIAAMIGVLLLQYLIGTAREIATIPYSQFEQLLKDGKVAEVRRRPALQSPARSKPVQAGPVRKSARQAPGGLPRNPASRRVPRLASRNRRRARWAESYRLEGVLLKL